MLTQEQKNKLEPLTHHEKYGKLLQEAIKGWEETDPKKDQYGIFFENNHFKLITETHYEQGCCLLGAAMINKKSDDDDFVSNSARDLFAINEEETSGLMSGFDGDALLYPNEAYEFGLKINKILFP